MRRAPAADHVGAEAAETGAGRASRGLVLATAAMGANEAGASVGSGGSETTAPDRAASGGPEPVSLRDATVAVAPKAGTSAVLAVAGSGRTATNSPAEAAGVSGAATAAGRGSPRRSGGWPGSGRLGSAGLTSVGEMGAGVAVAPAGAGRFVATGDAVAGAGAGTAGRPTATAASRTRAGACSSGVCSIGIAGPAGTAAVIGGTAGESGLASRLGSVAARQTGERLS